MDNRYLPNASYYSAPVDNAEQEIDPELLKRLTALGSVPDRQSLLTREMGLGADAASMPTAKGTQINSHLYIAASPMEHMANALQRVLGARREKNARSQYENTLGEQDAVRFAYAKAREEAMRRAQQPPEPFDGSSPSLISPLDYYGR